MRKLFLITAILAAVLVSGCTSEEIAQTRGAAWDAYNIARDVAWYVHYGW